MAIIIDATTVVVRHSALQRSFPGGVAGFQDQLTISTYRSDGIVCGVSFMVPRDARAFASELAQHGLSDPSIAASDDIAIISEHEGFLRPCSWLHLDLKSVQWRDGKTHGATVAWAGEEEPTEFAAPPSWEPQQLEAISEEDLKQHYEVVDVTGDREEGMVIACRHRETGRVMYVGRPASAVSRDPQAGLLVLRRDLGRLMDLPPSAEQRQAAAALCKLAKEVVEETNSQHPDALSCAGLAARLAGQWRDAEAAFRKLTELRPDLLDGWLELTWALASLGRLDEAETAARRAVAIQETPATLGNLASALLQDGHADTALPVIERARALDPSDKLNQTIHQMVRDVLDQRAASTSPDRPWYKRWFQ
jgi:Flp pilus assembly protein TadD